MFRILIVVILAVSLLPHTLVAQEPIQPPPIRVRVSVSGSEALKSSIHGNVVRELRAQGNIVVTEANPDWIVQIAALEIECPPGSKGSLVVSALILESFSNVPLRVFLSDKLDSATATAVERLTAGLLRSSRHGVEMVPVDHLESLTKGIASRFRSAVAYHQGSGDEKASEDRRMNSEQLDSQDTRD